jgi:ADP-ribose pyrophosphatase YjhB (NUDIX family)
MEELDKNSSSPPSITTPKVCVDALIDRGAGMISLIKRKNEPHGWALPGGFVDEGETVEEAILREVHEETGLNPEIVRQFHVYSDPKRDPRSPTVSVVFILRAKGQAKAQDDALEISDYHQMNLPEDLCFDHRQIINDYYLERY